jgi:hypothetical protein
MPTKTRPPPEATNATPYRLRLWSAAEVATFLGMSLRWVRQAAADGRLPCVRLPDARAVRFDANLVQAWAVKREGTPASRNTNAESVTRPSKERRVERRRASDGPVSIVARGGESSDESGGE